MRIVAIFGILISLNLMNGQSSRIWGLDGGPQIAQGGDGGPQIAQGWDAGDGSNTAYAGNVEMVTQAADQRIKNGVGRYGGSNRMKEQLATAVGTAALASVAGSSSERSAIMRAGGSQSQRGDFMGQAGSGGSAQSHYNFSMKKCNSSYYPCNCWWNPCCFWHSLIRVYYKLKQIFQMLSFLSCNFRKQILNMIVAHLFNNCPWFLKNWLIKVFRFIIGTWC